MSDREDERLESEIARLEAEVERLKADVDRATDKYCGMRADRDRHFYQLNERTNEFLETKRKLEAERDEAEKDERHAMGVMDNIDTDVANALESLGLDTLAGTGFPWRVDALIEAAKRFVSERDEARGKLDKLRLEVGVLHRALVQGLTPEVEAEIKALEPGHTVTACLVIDVANRQVNAIAKARENVRLAAEVERVTAERDAARRERDKALAEVGARHNPSIFDCDTDDLIRYGRRWLGLSEAPR